MEAALWMVEQLSNNSSLEGCAGQRSGMLDMAFMAMRGTLVVVQWVGGAVRSTDLFSTTKRISENETWMVSRDINTRRLVSAP